MIGILAGLKEELQPLLDLAEVIHHERRGQLESWILEIDNQPVYMAWAGVGKVAAAIATTHLIEHSGVTMVVITGTAGQIQRYSHHRTFVLTEAVQHDYGQLAGGRLLPYLAGELTVGDPVLSVYKLNQPVRDMLTYSEIDLPVARIATGDQFISDPEVVDRLVRETKSNLVDMETAAVAQVCSVFGVDWVGIKSVTDSADEEADESFQDKLEGAAKLSAAATRALIATNRVRRTN